MIMEFLIIVIASIFLASYSGEAGIGNVIALLDLPTLLCIAMLSVPLLFRRGMGKDFLRAFKMQVKCYWIFSRDEEKNLRFIKKTDTFTLGEMKRSLDAVEFMQKQILYGGIISMILPLIFVLAYLDALEKIGPNVAVTLLSVFYTAVLELLLLPLQVEVKRRIVNYMEEE